METCASEIATLWSQCQDPQRYSTQEGNREEFEDLQHWICKFPREAAQELWRTRRELQHCNDEREQLAQVIAHDLEEPLRMVASYAQLVTARLEGSHVNEDREFVGFMREGVLRMKSLFCDLLHYLECAGPLELATVDSNQVLKEVLSNLEQPIAQRGGIVSFEDLPIVTADFSKLVQLFTHLLGNAMKFHGSTPPRVHVSAQPLDREWVFCVRDQGIGIERRHHRRIFELFQRLHGRGEFEGNGLGLSLCKRIIELHHGRFWLESEPFMGTAFYFTLPKA